MKDNKTRLTSFSTGQLECISERDRLIVKGDDREFRRIMSSERLLLGRRDNDTKHMKHMFSDLKRAFPLSSSKILLGVAETLRLAAVKYTRRKFLRIKMSGAYFTRHLALNHQPQ